MLVPTIIKSIGEPREFESQGNKSCIVACCIVAFLLYLNFRKIQNII